ncbi:uncharacterized protein [Epargyreus clarus]|uniref:uncharacterized protein n=1 Tax=Epargyreus clarus TaxID=520877 RepID=UPI003C2E036C
MYKLIVLCMAIAVAAAAPSGVVYSSPILTPVAPQVVTSVVSPAVTSYSSYSNSVMHGTPVVTVPVVRQAHVVPVIHETPLHSLSYAYPEHYVV